MWLELRTIYDQLSHDPNVRVIILSGSGPRAFTAGLDVKAASQTILSPPSKASPNPPDPARIATQFRRTVATFQDCISSIERCEKPTICILHGISFGLAIDLSTATDIRFATSNAQFSVKEVDIGLAADVGTLSRLPKAVGNYGWVKEVCLSARVWGAEEAYRVGFVNRVFNEKDEAVTGGLELAKLIASKSPVAVQGTKELLNWSIDHSVADGLRYTGVWNSASTQTKDIEAALLSGLEKRKPTFEKL